MVKYVDKVSNKMWSHWHKLHTYVQKYSKVVYLNLPILGSHGCKTVVWNVKSGFKLTKQVVKLTEKLRKKVEKLRKNLVKLAKKVTN